MTTHANSRGRALAFAYGISVLSVIGLAHKGVFFKWLLAAGLDVVQLTAVRWLFSFPWVLMLFIAAVPAGHRRLPNWRELRLMALAQLFGVGSMMLHAESYVYLDASVTGVLIFVFPLFFVLGKLMRRDLPSGEEWLKAGLLVGALAALLGQAGAQTNSLAGVTMALGAAACWAVNLKVVYALTGDSTEEPLHPITYGFLAALTFFGAGMVMLWLHPVVDVAESSANSVLLHSVLLGFLASLLPATLMVLGMARLGTLQASFVASLNPPIACLAAALWLGEQLTVWHWTALLALGLASLPLSVLRNLLRPTPPPCPERR